MGYPSSCRSRDRCRRVSISFRITLCDERDHAVRKTFATFGLVIGLLNCYVGTGFAEVQQEWVTRHSLAVVQTIGVDATGSVYVTGYDTHWVTIKYDSHGNELWIARFGNGCEDYPTALTVNSAGDVYVTGTDSFLVCDEL